MSSASQVDRTILKLPAIIALKPPFNNELRKSLFWPLATLWSSELGGKKINHGPDFR